MCAIKDLAFLFKLIGTVKMPVKGWCLARLGCWGMLETGTGRELRPRRGYGALKRPVAIERLLKYQVLQLLTKQCMQ